MLDRRLHLHLVTWLGQWPAGSGLHVVGSRRRSRPAWDGRLRPAVTVAAPGVAVLSVPPERGRYLAGVGVRRHDRHGHESAVGTVPAARGRGLARRLVAQAARRVLDEGAVPTYLHHPGNTASARVAAAAGFPDRGWRSRIVHPD